MTKQKLKKCPWCKGEATAIYISDSHQIKCLSGQCEIQPYVTATDLEIAIQIWNSKQLRTKKRRKSWQRIVEISNDHPK